MIKMLIEIGIAMIIFNCIFEKLTQEALGIGP